MKKPPLDIQAAARVAQCVRLRDVVCVALEARHVGTPDLRPELTLSYDTPNSVAVWQRTDALLQVMLPFILHINAESEGEGPKKVRLAEIIVSLRIDYELEEVPDRKWSDDDVPHFAGINGYMHAWPYFRAEVQSLTTKLGLPPLTLPVIVSGHAAKNVAVQELSEVREFASPKPRRKRDKAT